VRVNATSVGWLTGLVASIDSTKLRRVKTTVTGKVMNSEGEPLQGSSKRALKLTDSVNKNGGGVETREGEQRGHKKVHRGEKGKIEQKRERHENKEKEYS